MTKTPYPNLFISSYLGNFFFKFGPYMKYQML